MAAERKLNVSSVTIAPVPPLTPQGILAEYRRLSPADVLEQAALFRRMQNSDQRELLFFMISHATKAIQIVHGLIDEDAAKTVAYSDMKTPTQ